MMRSDFMKTRKWIVHGIACLVMVAAGCTTKLGFEKRDSWPDGEPSDTVEVDVPMDEVPDVPTDEGMDVPTDEGMDVPADEGMDTLSDPVGEDVPVPVCGNGETESGEDCDGDPPRECDTSCSTVGHQTCTDCTWGECVPPPEICNDVDDDCDDFTDEAGALLIETGPLRITSDAGLSIEPDIDHDGTDHVVVWQDDRTGVLETFMAIVAADGTYVLEPMQVGSTLNETHDPTVIFASGLYNILVSDDVDGTPDLIFFRVSALGDVSGLVRTAVESDEEDYLRPAMVEKAGSFVIGWDTGATIISRGLNANGNPIGGMVVVEDDPGTSSNAGLATSGDAEVVVWEEERDGNPEIYAAVLVDGAVDVPDVRLTSDVQDSRSPVVIWDDTSFVVAWSDGRDGDDDIYLIRKEESGAVTGDLVQVTDVDGNARAPSLVYTGTGYGLAWTDDSGGGWTVRLVLLDTDGTPALESVSLSAGAGNAVAPAVSFTGDGLGVVWQDDVDGNEEIYYSYVVHGDCP